MVLINLIYWFKIWQMWSREKIYLYQYRVKRSVRKWKKNALYWSFLFLSFCSTYSAFFLYQSDFILNLPWSASVGHLSWDDLCALYTNIIRQPWSENRYLWLNYLSWLLHIKYALIAQSCTGRHLAELCREEYPPFVNICLWIIAELAVISDDIPEGWSVHLICYFHFIFLFFAEFYIWATYNVSTAVLGTAFAFNILFKIPVWAGVILTVFSTLLLLGVQRFGVRKHKPLLRIFQLCIRYMIV